MVGSEYLLKVILGALTINEFIERAMNRPVVETFVPIDTVFTINN